MSDNDIVHAAMRWALARKTCLDVTETVDVKLLQKAQDPVFTRALNDLSIAEDELYRMCEQRKVQ